MVPSTEELADSVDSVEVGLRDQDYLADEGLATAVFLALSLGRSQKYM